MYRLVSKSSFAAAFEQSEYYSKSFSYEGVRHLYDYLTLCETEENSSGPGNRFDVVGIACDFLEFNPKEFKEICDEDGASAVKERVLFGWGFGYEISYMLRNY